VRLPACAGTPRSMPVPDASPAALPRLRILVVDDDVMITALLRRLLHEHHDVTVENDSRRALVRLRAAERHDVILCDAMMPGMSGIELHAALLTAVPDQAERMIFMTGGAFTAHSCDFLARMEDRTLAKPFSAACLHTMLAQRIGALSTAMSARTG
jgi:CheY-like chemotaxis protein